jgi:hypothetical protein
MFRSNKIWINEHLSGRRDFIFIEGIFFEFPSSEHKSISDSLVGVLQKTGNLEIFKQTKNEASLMTTDGLWLCADGTLSINKITKNAFVQCAIFLEENLWLRLREDVMNIQGKKLSVYFSHLYGKILSNEENSIEWKIQLGIDKFVWFSNID